MRSYALPATALAATLLAAIPAAALARATQFSPRSIAGTYRGTWANQTFGTSGPITLTARSLSRNTVLTFRLDFGGTVFGCADPPPGDVRLPRGNGLNQWNASGFRIRRATRAFGQTSLTYRHAGRSLTGSGTAPPCAPQIRWTMTGRFVTATQFTGGVRIDLGGGRTAQTTLSARKVG